MVVSGSVERQPVVAHLLPGEGRHKLIPSLLRFDRFRKLLVRAIERIYPPRLTVAVFVSPQSVIH
jgi:hypothetical protein